MHQLDVNYQKYVDAANRLGGRNDHAQLLKMFIQESAAVPLLEAEGEQKIFNERDKKCQPYMVELSLERVKQSRSFDSNAEWIDRARIWSPVPPEDFFSLIHQRDTSPHWGRRVTASKKRYIGLRQAVIVANTRMIISMIKWDGKPRNGGVIYVPPQVPQMDVLMEGVIGLSTAFDKFDITKGYKFSTYAHNWVRQSMTRYLANEKGGNIRLPIHMVERIASINKAVSSLEKEHGFHFSSKDKAHVDLLCRYYRKSPLTRAQLVQALNYRANTFQDSLDAVFDYGHEDSMESNFRNRYATLAEADPNLDKVEVSQVQEVVEAVVEMLPSREAKIIRLRYGFGDYKPHTLQQVANRFKLSRERIRQIEQEALNKIKKELVKTPGACLDFMSNL